MSTWSLAQLLAGLHENIEHRLEIARKTLGHAGTKGDGSENVWLELFQTYLPTRYRAEKAHVVDSRDKFSQQIDVVIFDRQYSPFIFDHAGQKVIRAESVYAVFEAKQSINVEVIRYAQEKIGSVRSPLPHKSPHSPRRRNVSSQTAESRHRRNSYVSKRLEPSARHASHGRTRGCRRGRQAGSRLCCRPRDLFVRRERMLCPRASGTACHGFFV